MDDGPLSGGAAVGGCSGVDGGYCQVRSNVIHLDGSDLHNCCFLETYPDPSTLSGSECSMSHTDARCDRYGRYIREIIFRLFLKAGVSSASVVTMGDTLWALAGDAFGFQTDSLFNQMEDVVLCLFTMALRERELQKDSDDRDGGGGSDARLLGAELLAETTNEYHGKLFDNYLKWCDFQAVTPFPWGDDFRRWPWTHHKTATSLGGGGGCGGGGLAQTATEIVLFKLIWGEASNLRHTPELLCFLFHWAVTAWACGPSPVVPGEQFLDVVTAAVQRIRDESYYGVRRLRQPDHNRKLNYDDFNEMFWEAAPLRLLHSHQGTCWQQLSAASMRELLTALAGSAKPGEGVKTFVEQRSYLQVCRAFHRVWHWHFSALAALTTLRTVYKGAAEGTVRAQVGQLLVVAIFCSGVVPVLEILLAEPRSIKKSSFWFTLPKRQLFNTMRLGFLIAMIVLVVQKKGNLQDDVFQFNGTLGLAYWAFYLLHGALPLLFLRVRGRMPLFACLWFLPGIRQLFGPNTFTGGVALLAEDTGKVLQYSAFWVPPLAAKFAFWFWLVLPTVERAQAVVVLTPLRPLLLLGVPLRVPLLLLRVLLWAPLVAIWLYDTQVFFLLWGGLVATAHGWLLRVGFVQCLREVQKRVLPTFPSDAVVNTRRLRRHQPDHSQNQCGVGQGEAPETLATARTGLLSASDGPASSPQSESEPRRAYVNQQNPFGRVLLGSAVCEAEEAKRRAFGFVWNEVVHSWRKEDVISNDEQVRLQFCELPAFQSSKTAVSSSTAPPMTPGVPHALHSWQDVSDRRTLKVCWGAASRVRLPTFVYCDVVSSFLKNCENYQLLLAADRSRMARNLRAARFFKQNVSPSLVDQMEANLRSSLQLQAVWEVAEAFFLFLSRCFVRGHELVDATLTLWHWVCAKPLRLQQFDLRELRALRNVLDSLFRQAEQASPEVLRSAQAAPLPQIRDSLLRLVMATEEPEICRWQTAVKSCFSSPFAFGGWGAPPPLEAAELSSLALKLQQVNRADLTPATSTLGLFDGLDALAPILDDYGQKGNRKDYSGVAKEAVQTFRTLHRLESGAWLPQDVDSALRLFYRRALHVLNAQGHTLHSDESTRRLGFFVNSLLMRLPAPPSVAAMVSLTTLTPYYRESCVTDLEEMYSMNDAGITRMELLRSLMPEEFAHFLQRVDKDEEMFKLHQEFAATVQEAPEKKQILFHDLIDHLQRSNKLFFYLRFLKHLQTWAGSRSQVLSRTARGIMYYEQALRIVEFVESSPHAPLSHDMNRLSHEQRSAFWSAAAGLWEEVWSLPPPYLFAAGVKSLARVKFHYVVAAQEFGNDNRTKVPRPGEKTQRAQRDALLRRNGLLELMRQHSNLRMATLEPVLDPQGNLTGRKAAVLYRWAPQLLAGRLRASSLPRHNSSGASPSWRDLELHGEDDDETRPNSAGSRKGVRGVTGAEALGDEGPVPLRAQPRRSAVAAPAAATSLPTAAVADGFLQAVYRVELPLVVDESGNVWGRNPIIGPGKPENQNSAMIFTRGETLQAVDMNMDGYLEEALKLRNLLQEFTVEPRLRILGFREHIFSLDVSSISTFMALQELSFVTNNQRLYASALRVRMHYGHPDVFDRFFVQSCGSCSKSSAGVNLSEDVFAGYNATQRGFSVHQADYLQLGKGRDVGLQQIFMFEKKVSGGNAEQMLSRDVRRLMENSDFARMMSLYHSGCGFYLNTALLMLTVFVTLYSRVLLSCLRSTAENGVANHWELLLAPATTLQLQLGLLLILPIVLLLTLERGVAAALRMGGRMLLHLALLYYNFMVCTKAAVIDSVLVYGGARYQETGRGFVIDHAKLKSIWQAYFFTHFQLAAELLLLLVLYAVYGQLSPATYLLDTWGCWLLYASFTLTPFVYNPLGLHYREVFVDFADFRHWLFSHDADTDATAWRAWWRAEMDARADTHWHSKLLVFGRLLRFPVLAFALSRTLAFDLRASDVDAFLYVNASVVAVVVPLVLAQEVKHSDGPSSRAIAVTTVVGAVAAMAYVLASGALPLRAFCACGTVFMITLWALVRLALVAGGRHAVRNGQIEIITRYFHFGVAYIVFVPILLLASFTASFHLIQSRVLFNRRFVRTVDAGLAKRAEMEKKGL